MHPNVRNRFATIHEQTWCRSVIAAALIFLFATMLPAQQPAKLGAVRVFRDPDGVFRFGYATSLVTCQRDPNQPDFWIPSESCEASIPVCSIGGDTSGTIACVAYPAEQLKKTTNFAAAAFSINTLKGVASEQECLKITEPPPQYRTFHETINGTKFKVAETDGAATSTLVDGYIYRSFHRNKCYELDIRIVYLNPNIFEPARKEFDIVTVRRRLKEVLRSFKFLK